MRAPADVGENWVADLAPLLERSPADVAILAEDAIADAASSGVMVAFSGSEHDWAALELGAWLALANESTVTLLGTSADVAHGRPDASRLLADASLAVQRVVGIETMPLLVDPTPEALVAAVQKAAAVVLGLPARWKAGLGATREALIRDASPPVLLVHAGPRPGALAPAGSRTRYTWSLSARTNHRR